MIAVQVVLFAAAVAWGRPLLYPVCWLASWMSLWKVSNRLRAIAEHGGMARSDDRRLTTHHVRQRLLARFLIVPYNTGWHLAHHVDIAVPFRNLPAFHDELVRSGWVVPDLEYPSYWALWRKLASGERRARAEVARPARRRVGQQLHPWVELRALELRSPAMYPGHWAQVTPDRPAVVMAGADPDNAGDAVTYRELDERSTRLARVWHNAGLRPGDGVALFMENQPRFLEVVWAALRSGLRVTPVNRYLTAAEAAYIVNDCDAGALVTSTAMAPVAAELVGHDPRLQAAPLGRRRGRRLRLL